MRKFGSIKVICLILAASALVPATIRALDYPSSPVSVIVPYGAGGGTDLIGRALADAMKTSFSRGIAVENRTGGGGSVGMSYGQNARPDGNIITMITVELVTLPHTGTGGDIYYDKFKPLMMVNSAYSAVTVQKSSPYNTLADLMAAAKENPLQVGNSGIGAIWHLAAAGLEQAAGVEFIHVPFDGAAPAITSLLGGHIDAVSVSYAEVISQIEAGELKVLAVLAPQRLASAPDVPTTKELGYDVSVGTWRGFGVPLATPRK
jgi:tripartite-type tricarboxylate transporter receptor subunit TctC